MPYNIYLSQDPFDDIFQIQVDDFGTHATMGMIFHQCPYRHLPQLKDILPSQPCSRIKKWRSTIKNSYCVQIEEHIIETIQDITLAIAACRQSNLKSIQMDFAVDKIPSGIHPTLGLPMLFADQLNIIAQNVIEITEEHRDCTRPTNEDEPPDLVDHIATDDSEDEDDCDDEASIADGNNYNIEAPADANPDPLRDFF